MRIPFDNKSHKRALRLARRAKESSRMATLQRDPDAPAPTRKARRYGATVARGVAYALVALALVTMPAMARGASTVSHHGNNGHTRTSHAGASTNSATSGFRAYFGGGK